MKEILILTSPDGSLWMKHIKTNSGKVDIWEIKHLFEEKGYAVKVDTFAHAQANNYSPGTYVLYASSENRGDFYKQYIEDIILGLELKGLILIPEFKFFRAHNNKVFSEIVRSTFKEDILKVPKARVYGSYGELVSDEQQLEFPCVVKSASGSGSSGVFLVKEENQLGVLLGKKAIVH